MIKKFFLAFILNSALINSASAISFEVTVIDSAVDFTHEYLKKNQSPYGVFDIHMNKPHATQLTPDPAPKHLHSGGGGGGPVAAGAGAVDMEGEGMRPPEPEPEVSENGEPIPLEPGEGVLELHPNGTDS